MIATPPPHDLGPPGDKIRASHPRGVEHFDAWLANGKARIVAQTSDTLVLAVWTPWRRQEIRFRFGSEIEKAFGVSKLKLVVREPAT